LSTQSYKVAPFWLQLMAIYEFVLTDLQSHTAPMLHICKCTYLSPKIVLW